MQEEGGGQGEERRESGGEREREEKEQVTRRARGSSRGSYFKACSMKVGGHEQEQAAEEGTLQGEWD